MNQYLRESAKQSITAKDFRTWWGSVIALAELADIDQDLSKTQCKKIIHAAVATTAEALGNTKAVCRKSYIHPGILAAAESGELRSLVANADKSNDTRRELTVDETRFANLLPHLEFK